MSSTMRIQTILRLPRFSSTRSLSTLSPSLASATYVIHSRLRSASTLSVTSSSSLSRLTAESQERVVIPALFDIFDTPTHLGGPDSPHLHLQIRQQTKAHRGKWKNENPSSPPAHASSWARKQLPLYVQPAPLLFDGSAQSHYRPVAVPHRSASTHTTNRPDSTISAVKAPPYIQPEPIIFDGPSKANLGYQFVAEKVRLALSWPSLFILNFDSSSTVCKLETGIRCYCWHVRLRCLSYSS